MQPSGEREMLYEDEIDLRELVATLLRRKWWIVGVTVAALAVAGVLSFAILPPTYAVSVQVMLPANQGLLAGVAGNGAANAAIQGYAALAFSDAVLQQVERSVGWERTYTDLRQSFDSQLDTNSGTLTVTARAQTAQEAYQLAKAWRGAFRTAALDLARQQLDGQIQAADRKVAAEQAALDRLKATLDRAPGGSATSTMVSALAVGQVLAQAQGDRDRLLALRQSLDSVAAPLVLQDARLPDAPVAPRKALNLAVALVLGLMVGVFAAFVADFWARGREAERMPAAAGPAPSQQG